MSMIRGDINQQTGKKIPLALWRKWLAKIERVLLISYPVSISVAIVGDRAIQQLNALYRRKNQVTDVLSFGNTAPESAPDAGEPVELGEIIICYPQAVRQAKHARRSTLSEIEQLFIHGFLHLSGYDHVKKKDAKTMAELEKNIYDQSN